MQEDRYESSLRMSEFQNYIIVNGAKEQTGPNIAFMQTVRQLKMETHNTEPYSPWQNRCETTIGLLKKI